MIKVEVLYFQGCPNHEPAVERVRGVLAEEGVSAPVLQIEVLDRTSAETLRFPGSPTVRINGIDVEGTPAPGAFGLSCRTYLDGSVLQGIPAVEVIRRAVRNAKESPQ